MKKIQITICMLLLLALMTGCKKETQDENENSNTITPTTQPIVTLPAEVTPQENPTEAAGEDTKEEVLTIGDYYPIQSDNEYIFEGEGNEYASFRRYIDFIDLQNNKLQTRTNNGGTETVRVLEIVDGKLIQTAIVNECYYRDNLMDKATVEEDDELLLMEPLKEGTEWILSDGRKRYISGTNVSLETPAGSFKAIEVTTESADSNTKDYYALGVGLVKSIFEAEDMEVTSSLSEINKSTPYTQMIEVFYPDTNEKIYVEQLTLTFHTGDITRKVMEDALKKKADKETYLNLASEDTIINSLYLGEDGIVYVDFSSDFVQDMNAGAGYEQLILQSVTNTLGNYYGVNKVYITLEGEPFTSGHVQMKKGEAFTVNMDLVVR